MLCFESLTVVEYGTSRQTCLDIH